MPSWPHWPSKGFWLAAGLSLSIVLKLYLCKNTMRLRKPSQNRKVKFSKKTEPFFSRNYQILYPHSSLWLHDIIYLPGGLFCRRVHQSFRNVQSLRGELFGVGPVKGEEECYGQNCADNWKERLFLEHPGIHSSIHSSTIWKNCTLRVVDRPTQLICIFDIHLLSWRWRPLWSGGTLYQWSLQLKKSKLSPILFSQNIRIIYKLSVKKQETGRKLGENPPK